MTGAMTLPFAARAQSGSGVNSGTVILVAKDAAVPPDPVPPDPPSVGTIPMSFNDPMFTNMAETTSQVWCGTGENASHKSVTGPASGDVSFGGSGNNNFDYCRCDGREGLHVGGAGYFNVTNCWIQATGQGLDHADGIQAYAPGKRGTLKVRNSTMKVNNTSATAGVFIADDWTGTIDIQDCMIWGGPYGLRVHPDVGGDNDVYLKNVYFVGPFAFGPIYLSDVLGHVNHIRKWENVRNATIENGVLKPGWPIKPPKPVKP
jgi:hypothetical protein